MYNEKKSDTFEIMIVGKGVGLTWHRVGKKWFKRYLPVIKPNPCLSILINQLSYTIGAHNII